MTNRLITIIIAGTLWSTVLNAHHNAGSHYIMDQTITVEGVVTEFRLINPHMRVYFDVTTADGDVEKWLGEGQASCIARTNSNDAPQRRFLVRLLCRPGGRRGVRQQQRR